jgi:DNA-binding NarL/FixJ family response regulator
MRVLCTAAMLIFVSFSCLIVDDNSSFLAASQSVLQGQGVRVVGVARTVAEGLQRVHELKPDLVLVDIDLGEESGFDLARRLAARDHGGVSIILISTHPEDDFADLIVESPALGFVPKSDLSRSAIELVLEGYWGEACG